MKRPHDFQIVLQALISKSNREDLIDAAVLGAAKKAIGASTARAEPPVRMLRRVMAGTGGMSSYVRRMFVADVRAEFKNP